MEVIAGTEKELIEAVRAADAAGVPVRVLGPGDPAAPGSTDGPAHDAQSGASGGASEGASEIRIVRVATRDLSVNDDDCGEDALAFCGAVQVAVAAGWRWDDFVALAVGRDWVGIERLSGLPGSVAGVTTANARSFGQAPADAVAAVRTFDRAEGVTRRFAAVDCEFGDDGSRFSRARMADGTARYVILSVEFLFRLGDLTDPIRDDALARALGLQPGERARLPRVRDAVLATAP